jgi:Spy/CpxP family protein refolding chaperone
MRKQLLVMVALVAVGCLYANAIPIPQMGGPMEGPGDHNLSMPGPTTERVMDLLVVVLDLKDSQNEQIAQLLDAERTQKEKGFEALQIEERSLQQLLENVNFDEKAVLTQAALVVEKRIDMLISGAKLKAQVLAVLNAEQQAKAEKIFKLMGPPPHGPGRPI